MKSESHPYLTTLTPLRGIAALFVVIFHCNLMVGAFLPRGYTQFLDYGWLWVDFFFVLSGFIMCYAYGKYFAKSVTKNDFGKFIGARFARVYPLNFITAIWAFVCSVIIVHLSTGLAPFFEGIFKPSALPASLLLVQSMHVGYLTAPLNTPSWSLSTEWWAYMIFPFIVPLFIRLKSPGKIVATLLIIAFYIVLRYEIGPISYSNRGPAPTLNFLTDFGFLRCLAGFFTGMLLFTFYEHRSGYEIIRRDWFFVLSFIGGLAAMHFGIMDIMIVAFFPLIIISAAYNQTIIKKFLDMKVLQRLGDWSFTIYMVHVPIIFTFIIFRVNSNPAYYSDFRKLIAQKPNYGFGLVMCLVIVNLTIVTAALVYRFFEVPARNYFNRVFKTRHPKILAEDTQV
jgi:peptidoglycan/LPS O-acetylase OafA/YrhL